MRCSVVVIERVLESRYSGNGLANRWIGDPSKPRGCTAAFEFQGVWTRANGKPRVSPSFFLDQEQRGRSPLRPESSSTSRLR
jgi:hypothetical protein